MPYRVTCPGCRQQLTLPEDVLGKQIACEFCSRPLRIGTPAQASAAPKSAAKPAAPTPAAKPTPPPQPAPKNTAPDDFNIDKPPGKPAASAAPGVQAQRPAPAKTKAPPAARTPARRPAEDEEPIIRPRREHRPAFSATTWWVLGSAAALLLFGAGVGLAFLVHDGVSPDRT